MVRTRIVVEQNAIHVVIAVHEDGLALGDRVRETLDGNGKAKQTLRVVQLLQTRAQVSLRRINVEIPPPAEELADNGRKVQLRREGGDGGGIDGGGHDPPRLRARACNGCGHA